MIENRISKLILDSAIAVHRELGPGLLESVYEIVLAYELQQRGLRVDHQVPIAIRHKDMVFDAAFRADLVVGKGVSGIKISGTDQRSPQEAGANLSPVERVQAGFLAELW